TSKPLEQSLFSKKEMAALFGKTQIQPTVLYENILDGEKRERQKSPPLASRRRVGRLLQCLSGGLFLGAAALEEGRELSRAGICQHPLRQRHSVVVAGVLQNLEYGT